MAESSRATRTNPGLYATATERCSSHQRRRATPDRSAGRVAASTRKRHKVVIDSEGLLCKEKRYLLHRRIAAVSLTLRNLKEDLEDLGSRFDGAPDLEFRLATEALELEQSGLGYQRVPPGYRFPYGHTHKKGAPVVRVEGHRRGGLMVSWLQQR
jgi:hypothetical protein